MPVGQELEPPPAPDGIGSHTLVLLHLIPGPHPIAVIVGLPFKSVQHVSVLQGEPTGWGGTVEHNITRGPKLVHVVAPPGIPPVEIPPPSPIIPPVVPA